MGFEDQTCMEFPMGSIHLMHPGEYMGVCSPQHQAAKKLGRFHAASNQLKNGKNPSPIKIRCTSKAHAFFYRGSFAGPSKS